MGSVLTNVGQSLTTNLGIQRDIFDVGWPAAASIAFGTKVGMAVIPIALIVNIIFLVLKLTKTLNVDVWNYWHFAFLGSLVSIATKNVVYGMMLPRSPLHWRCLWLTGPRKLFSILQCARHFHSPPPDFRSWCALCYSGQLGL